ncbi:hypothetical protein M2137_002231 [Parabacteroides sp. PFB2-10]|nr:hypothetical protein [Parabacteroides sp. PFB2-10]
MKQAILLTNLLLLFIFTGCVSKGNVKGKELEVNTVVIPLPEDVLFLPAICRI